MHWGLRNYDNSKTKHRQEKQEHSMNKRFREIAHCIQRTNMGDF